ncbi:MAG TPA: LamG-like jellyroll fold domain-containing protein, partial [Verrucomicrobiae bacterium]|nr:LamG-like jellyroll fold domain-containing protein [Verrucomicrobiae bacterium]
YTNVTLAQSGYNAAEPGETSMFVSPALSPSLAGRITGVDFAVTNASANFTVEAWDSCVTGGNSGGAPVVSEGTYLVNDTFALGVDTNSSTKHYQFYVRGSDGTVYKADDSLGVQADDSPNWHHLVGVCDETHTNVSLYVDGRLAARVYIPANAGNLEAHMPMAIGAGITSGAKDYNFNFGGYIDDVAVYPAALSAAQVAAHYAAPGNDIPVSFVPPLPPLNLTYLSGGTLTIPASLVGAPPVGYYWTNVTAGGVIASGQSTNYALDATLTISGAPAGLSGDQLELVVTNASGSTNWFVTLASPAAPVALDYSSAILYSNSFNGGTWSIGNMPLTAANILVGGTNTVWADVLGTNNPGGMEASGVDATTFGDSWLLPFTPHSGYLYTITASVTFSGNPGSWTGPGFANQYVNTNAVNPTQDPKGANHGRFTDDVARGYDWMILTELSGNLQYFAGLGTAGTITNKSPFFIAGPGTHVVNVVLDTTGAAWKGYGFVDGVPAGTNTYGSTPSIGAVGLTQNAQSAPGNLQWNYFTLSQTAPGGVPPYLLNPLPPTNSILLTNGIVTLPATAFGSAPLGYYWSDNSSVIASGSTNVMAPLPATLEVPAGTLAAGQLQLVVTNAYGTNITLISLVNPNPGSFQYSVAGNQLTLSWPTNTGWTLQVQTNSLSTGISTNWVDVANSTTTNQLTVPVNQTSGSVFYRLILP